MSVVSSNPPAELVSVVIPCYRSEQTIEKVVSLTRKELRDRGYSTQFVLVDDCSPDETFDAIDKLSQRGDDVLGVGLAKNFGQHGAILSGLNHAEGDIVVLMDDDMQTHPSQIGTLLAALSDRVDVVIAKYPAHKEAAWRRLGSAFWRWTMRVMTGSPKEIELTSFVVMRGWVARQLTEYKGPYPVVQGLIFRVTSRVVNAEVTHFDRESGTSGYTLKSLVRLWSNVLNFSLMPLRITTMCGVVMGASGIIGALVLVIRKLIYPDIPVGWSSIMVAMLTFAGIVLFALGMVGEYVGRIFMTSNDSPQFVERTLVGRRDDIERHI